MGRRRRTGELVVSVHRGGPRVFGQEQRPGGLVASGERTTSRGARPCFSFRSARRRFFEQGGVRRMDSGARPRQVVIAVPWFGVEKMNAWRLWCYKLPLGDEISSHSGDRKFYWGQ
ncbi:hypothetical protein RchiOBHm_Chr1g0345381 [Rosa chinensis]|uniref:Uncharacterized protein n=1 Tax=Rosa chinensis TaxID=74649 RepID=A0A2P6SES0_ROSCH|nr:hypothetical protein RchiOBHm_Chr1g0345381 [Rosa chinensis]